MMSVRRVPSRTLGELQPPAGLRSLRESARSVFIRIARELRPEIDQTLLALCGPEQPAVEPAVLASWARRFNLNVGWFIERATRVIETRYESVMIERECTADEWRSSSRLDAAWRVAAPVIGKSASTAYFAPGHPEDCRRTSPHVSEGTLKAVHNRADPTIIETERHVWTLTLKLNEWQHPQAWRGGPTSYVGYVHRAIEPELRRYRRHVLEQLRERGWKRPQEFDSREVFEWLARRVVNRESAYRIAKELPAGDNRHRSGVHAQTVKLARYLKLKIP
jgi:hypothetical protein